MMHQVCYKSWRPLETGINSNSTTCKHVNRGMPCHQLFGEPVQLMRRIELYVSDSILHCPAASWDLLHVDVQRGVILP